jgi:hypothetical protein
MGAGRLSRREPKASGTEGLETMAGGAGLRDLNASACPISRVEPAAAEQQFWSRADLEQQLHGVSTADVNVQTLEQTPHRRSVAALLIGSQWPSETMGKLIHREGLAGTRNHQEERAQWRGHVTPVVIGQVAMHSGSTTSH